MAGADAKRLLLGIGDDAALWQPSRSHRSAITTDAYLEGIHFTREMPLLDVGYRAMAATLSDLSAMGAKPVLATIALGLPQRTQEADVRDLYRGMLTVAKAAGAAIAGGDLTRSPELLLSITAVGEVRPSHVKTRGGARPGDVLAVTGELGSARAGWMSEREHGAIGGAHLEAARSAYARPVTRFAEARWLAASANVRAMLDLSDGLSTDLLRLCEASACGACVDVIPVSASARAFAAATGEDGERFALAGGDDYEILAAIDARAFRYLEARYRARFGRRLLAVGRMCPKEEGMTVLLSGERVALESTGWDHFGD